MRPLYLVIILVLLTLALPALPVHAGGVVTVCDEAHLLAALVGGGTVTFTCSGTITLTGTITITTDTSLDGRSQNVLISGGGRTKLIVVTPNAALTLKWMTIMEGSSSSGFPGGGIENEGDLYVVHSTFFDNFADDYGGAIANGGTAIISDTIFSDNLADTYGGAIFNSGTMVVRQSAFNTNVGDFGGGAIYNLGLTTLENIVFLDNSVGDPEVGLGGGILNRGTLTIRSSTFSDNHAGGSGGAISSGYGSETYLFVSDSTFSSNSAGGGGAIQSSSTMTITNSTFFDNGAGTGGGIASTGMSVEVINSTFSGNRATYGAGLVQLGSYSLVLKNTIVANNSSGNNCIGEFTNGGGNLSYPDNTCPGVNADPLLGPLQNNGGPTETMALLPGSAAIDAGIDATCGAAPVNNLDQRGVTRPQGPHCDIGAVEHLLPFRKWLPAASAQ